MQASKARRTGRDAEIMAAAVGAPSVSPWVQMEVQRRKATIWRAVAVVASALLAVDMIWRISR